MTDNDKTLVAWLHNEAAFAEDEERKNILIEIADRIKDLDARVAELEAVVDDLLIRFDPWSPHDHDAAKRARAALGDRD